MSKNPPVDYTPIIIKGFKKAFPVLPQSDPEAVALRIYEDASAFSGRDGRSNAGGGFGDISSLISAAAGIELDISNAREIKDSLRAKLRRAWVNNDHEAIFKKARDFERSASMAVIDLREVAWADPYRISEECDEEEGMKIPETVEEWVQTLCEPSQAQSVIGNRSRNRLRRKPPSRVVKSLFEGNL